MVKEMMTLDPQMYCDSEIPHPSLVLGFRELASLLTGVSGIRLK